MAREWFHPPRKAEADETVASFVERHYGPEMVDRLADPLLSGVYGGEAAQLSVRAVLPRFAEMEATYGSLGRAMLAARRKMGHASKVSARLLFTSLKDGMQQLVDAIVSRLPASALNANTLVQRVERQNGGWVISAGYASDEFDAVIMAIPAYSAAELLSMTNEDLAAELRGSNTLLPSRSISATTALCAHPCRRALVLLCLPAKANACSWPRLCITSFHTALQTIAPCFAASLAGRATSRCFEAPYKEIVRMVREELGQIIKLKADPLFTRVYRWRRAMAQYGQSVTWSGCSGSMAYYSRFKG